MANATREPATTLLQPVSTPKFSPNPSFKLASASPRLSSSNPQLTSLANAGLSASPKPIFSKGAMPPNFQPPPLTGAAAMADNARYAREMEERKSSKASPKTSPNPARTAFMGLTSQSMSRPEDAPPPPTLASKPKITPSIVTEPMEMDDPHASPTIMSSPVDMTAANPLTSSPGAHKSRKRPASPRTEERPMKAMTYPPGFDEDSPSPPHNPQFPAQSSTNTPSKSPSYSSAKKHKCPHCSTEFTRHHNLKSHLLTHSQEKPYGCQQCSSRFRRLHDLKRHLKLHTGERPHICEKCGRKFARGDALARHNKGPGGCAGRRGSGGDGDEFGEGTSEVDQSMGGASYQGEEGREAAEDEEQYANEHRRRSEPDTSRNDSLPSGVVSTSGGSYHQHSSTYPGIAPISNISRGLYPPPPASNQSSANSPRTSSRHPSPKPPGGLAFSSVQYNAPSLYAQNLMTESPKPLSPGQVDTRRHSPSISSQLQQTRLGRSIGGGSNLNSLPPPITQGAQLPSLTSMTDTRFAQQPSGHPPSQPPQTFAMQPAPGAVSAAGSGSSHQQSSGGSMREIMSGSPSGGAYSQQEASLREYARNMDRRLEEASNRLKDQETRYEGEISRLRDEITMLRAQAQRSQPTLRGQQQQPQ